MRMLYCARFVLLAVALAIVAALFLAGSAGSAHEFYANKFSPTKDANGASRGCCNTRDCALAPVRLNEQTGEIEIFVRDQWWLAMDPRWYVGESPDGSWHVCIAPHDTEVRCSFGAAGT